MSLNPPVPPVKPRSTYGGRLALELSTWVPSIVTVMPDEKVVTTKWCTALMSDGIDELVVTYFMDCMGDDAVAMPTKLLDGSVPFAHVSSEMATPLMPEKPSPPPLLPKAVGAVRLASASGKVNPSAPALGPMNASNAAVTPDPGTGVG